MVFYFKARPEAGDYTIFMGLDMYENEELIKYGIPEDVWFHVDKMSSAHVYLRLQKGQTIEDISEGVLEDCAQLVKANSIQGNKVNNVDIVYTPWQNLKKTASMDVGQVGFYNSKMVRTVRVEKRVNAIINRLNRTKVERTPDLKAEREAINAAERAQRKLQLREKKRREELDRLEKERQAELRSYKNLAGNLEGWKAFGPFFTVVWSFSMAAMFVSAERSFKLDSLSRNATVKLSCDPGSDLLSVVMNFLWQENESGYQHVWPDLAFNWEIVVGSFIGFLGAAFGSVGGVGGGGIFVPMLTLVVGFDAKSATAISKCMIMGAAASTVYYNLKLRHPTIDMPIIDYDLAVLIQPMLMLGISIGVAFNVLFADWMVTVLLIILFIGTSTKAFFKGVETWNKETIMKKEAVRRSQANGNGQEADYKLLPAGPSNEAKGFEEQSVGIMENVCWKECGLLFFVWFAFLALQIIKTKTTTCSVLYWVVNLLQVPVALGVSGYEGLSLYKGWRKLGSKGEDGTNFKIHQLVIYGLFGILAGLVGGLLGLGGGFIMGPLFLELGIPPQVSSATATFAMMFSSSMSVVEYYLLKRFPVPYALYFIAVATVAALIGQHVVRRLIVVLGRASIIIFILASTIFISAISLGGVGISNMIGKIQRHEYMGFDNLCKYDA